MANSLASSEKLVLTLTLTLTKETAYLDPKKLHAYLDQKKLYAYFDPYLDSKKLLT